MVQNWIEDIVESADGRGREGRHQNLLLYVDDGVIAF